MALGGWPGAGKEELIWRRSVAGGTHPGTTTFSYFAFPEGAAPHILLCSRIMLGPFKIPLAGHHETGLIGISEIGLKRGYFLKHL